MALIHGGQLQQVAAKFSLPVTDWLDLSTGIAPYSYPIPDIPPHLWQQLPQSNPALISAAQRYYQASQLLVTNGSQSVIKILPSLWQHYRPQSQIVFLPLHGYKEHQHAWQQAGFTIVHYHQQLPAIEQLCPGCVLVIINPNNPTGQLFSHNELASYQHIIAQLGGLLIIDEAFMDVVTPSQSLSSTENDADTIILRSFGKFFGLAGIRIGFVIANKQWLDKLNEALGPWQVNGPAQYIAQHALQDHSWQQQQAIRLNNASHALEQQLSEVFYDDRKARITGTSLFKTVTFKQRNTTAPSIYQALCQQGVYVRLTDEQQALRFGIPSTKHLPRLAESLKKATNSS